MVGEWALFASVRIQQLDGAIILMRTADKLLADFCVPLGHL